PALPANWSRVDTRNVRAGEARYDVTIERASGRLLLRIGTRGSSPSSNAAPLRVMASPALPLDARVRNVTVNGTAARYQVIAGGDVQRVQVAIDARPSSATDVVF